MSRDYKPTPGRQKPAGRGSAFFSGFLLGIVVGVGASLAVAVFVTGGKTPFKSDDATVRPAIPSEADKTPNANNAAIPVESTTNPNRFDFYKILPGDNQVTDQEAAKNKAEQEKAQAAKETFYLQVGAFPTEADADNLKAKLALIGLEAVVQTATTDKGIWHRVRVGPYGSPDQVAKARSVLVQNNFAAELVKVPNTVPDQ
ncbi:MAG: SPOR domain-containing protein [Methylobacillus sp.]|jgi:cell division protein FtsN|nr:SPOR domain-containing protein [Methylobacillus sp.]